MAPQDTKHAPTPAPATRYEDDLYTWVQEQVALLRSGSLGEIDAVNIAEELADVGRSQFKSLVSSIAIVSQHILKWDHQAGNRSRSWELSVREHRRQINDELADSPGLKSRLAEGLERGYSSGRDRALAETGLDDAAIPIHCPYSLDDIMTRPIVYETPAPSGKRRRSRAAR